MVSRGRWQAGEGQPDDACRWQGGHDLAGRRDPDGQGVGVFSRTKASQDTEETRRWQRSELVPSTQAAKKLLATLAMRQQLITQAKIKSIRAAPSLVAVKGRGQDTLSYRLSPASISSTHSTFPVVPRQNYWLLKRLEATCSILTMFREPTMVSTAYAIVCQILWLGSLSLAWTRGRKFPMAHKLDETGGTPAQSDRADE